MNKSTATHAVLVGNSLPAHDEVFDLAEQIGDAVGTVRTYDEQGRDTMGGTRIRVGDRSRYHDFSF